MTVLSDGWRPAYRAHMAAPLTSERAEQTGRSITDAGMREGFRLGADVDYANGWLVVLVPTDVPPDPERLPELEALIAAAPGVTGVERLP